MLPCVGSNYFDVSLSHNTTTRFTTFAGLTSFTSFTRITIISPVSLALAFSHEKKRTHAPSSPSYGEDCLNLVSWQRWQQSSR